MLDTAHPPTAGMLDTAHPRTGMLDTALDTAHPTARPTGTDEHDPSPAGSVVVLVGLGRRGPARAPSALGPVAVRSARRAHARAPHDPVGRHRADPGTAAGGRNCIARVGIRARLLAPSSRDVS